MAHFRPKPRNEIRATAILLMAALSFMAQTPSTQQTAVETNGAAKLLTFVGQISVIRSNYAWALDVGKTVNRQETIVTGSDGWGVFEVADGSKFEVFPNSKVVFRPNMGEWRDLLEVWLGKVRVQIEHFGGLPNNNKVHTPSAVISVRGTIFDVEVLPETEDTIVSDEEGSVGVEHALKPGALKVLNRGESIVVHKNEALAKALIDKGGLFQHGIRSLSDALYQVAVNARGSGPGHVGTPASTGSGSAGDKNNGTTTAPPPPAPIPPPH
jgi:ferric-dicitrate binding protein FerR (iron transport regulator)